MSKGTYEILLGLDVAVVERGWPLVGMEAKNMKLTAHAAHEVIRALYDGGFRVVPRIDKSGEKEEVGNAR